jgi:hypothetical protein
MLGLQAHATRPAENILLYQVKEGCLLIIRQNHGTHQFFAFVFTCWNFLFVCLVGWWFCFVLFVESGSCCVAQHYVEIAIFFLSFPRAGLCHHIFIRVLFFFIKLAKVSS